MIELSPPRSHLSRQSKLRPAATSITHSPSFATLPHVDIDHTYHELVLSLCTPSPDTISDYPYPHHKSFNPSFSHSSLPFSNQLRRGLQWMNICPTSPLRSPCFIQLLICSSQTRLRSSPQDTLASGVLYAVCCCSSPSTHGLLPP